MTASLPASSTETRKPSYGHCLQCGAMFYRDGLDPDHGPERGEPRQYCSVRCKNRRNYLNRKAAKNRLLPEGSCAHCGIREGQKYAEAVEYQRRVLLGFMFRRIKRETRVCWKAKLVTRDIEGTPTILCGRCNSAHSRTLFYARVPPNERWRYASRKFEERVRARGSEEDRIRKTATVVPFRKNGEAIPTTGTVTAAELKARIAEAKRLDPLPSGLTPAQTIRALRSDRDDEYYAYLDSKNAGKR